MCAVYIFIIYLIFCVCVCVPAHRSIYHMCSGARGDQKKHQILWNWRYRGCELPGEWWELNMGALQEP